MSWSYEFFVEPDGSAPIQDFLGELSDAEFGKVAQVLQLLKQYGPTLPFPWSSQVRGKLRELRCHYGKKNFRLLYYCDSNRVFILLHGFTKTTASLPRADVETAENRMKRDQDRKEKRK